MVVRGSLIQVPGLFVRFGQQMVRLRFRVMRKILKDMRSTAPNLLVDPQLSTYHSIRQRFRQAVSGNDYLDIKVSQVASRYSLKKCWGFADLPSHIRRSKGNQAGK